jgi:hypothetical protein
MSLGSQTVTLVVEPGRDRFGDIIPGSGSETTVNGCMVQPDTTNEVTDGRDTITTSLRAWLPAGTVVAATAKVRYDGTLYSVDGEPSRWIDFEGVEDHVELRLRIVEG